METQTKQPQTITESEFTGFWQKVEKDVLFLINKIVQDYHLAEDFTQNTFMKVWRAWKDGRYQFFTEEKFVGYVKSVAFNLAIDQLRARSRNQRMHVPSVTDPDETMDFFMHNFLEQENAEQVVISDEQRMRVKNMISKLPTEQQEIVILRHYADMRFPNIAAMTGVSINTSLGRMRYALINLRKMQTPPPQ